MLLCKLIEIIQLLISHSLFLFFVEATDPKDSEHRALEANIVLMRYGTSEPADDRKSYSDIGSIAAACQTSRRLVEAVIARFERRKLDARCKKYIDEHRYEREMGFADNALSLNAVV